MLVTIVAKNMAQAREAAATIGSALTDIGDYHFVSAKASKVEAGRKIEMTFREQER